MSNVCFVDTETTGLDPDLHQIWEVAIICPDGWEQTWFLPVDLGRADPFALKIGHFHERYKAAEVTRLDWFAKEFADLTRGMHLCGAVPSFDEERLRRLLKANGACPEWHYHLIDVEALAVGWLRGYTDDQGDDDVSLPLPWNSDNLSRECGIEPPNEDERHTAMGDAKWAKRLYERIAGTVGQDRIGGKSDE